MPFITVKRSNRLRKRSENRHKEGNESLPCMEALDHGESKGFIYEKDRNFDKKRNHGDSEG